MEFREGLLICREDDRQRQWSEAAPLPGLSRENLADVTDAARGGRWTAYPSLRFAYESLDLESASAAIPVSGLVWDTGFPPRGRSLDMSRPSRIVKLKVARGPLSSDVANVVRLRRTMRPNQEIRLDANRRWTFKQAVEFAHQIGPDRIAYIEEPVESPEDFERWTHESKLRYALDETLRETRELDQFVNAAAFVIKPTLMNGIQSIRDLATRGIQLVFSASFESGIGLMRIAQLASQLSPDSPAGLDTYAWLSRDVVKPRWELFDGYFRLNAHWDIDHAELKELRP